MTTDIPEPTDREFKEGEFRLPVGAVRAIGGVGAGWRHYWANLDDYLLHKQAVATARFLADSMTVPKEEWERNLRPRA